MKKILIFAVILALLAGAGTKLSGYLNVYAHPEINRIIVKEMKKRFYNYIQNYPEFKKFQKYYIGLDLYQLPGTAVTASGEFIINEAPDSKTPLEWIKHGGYSADEPEAPAALRHFYDPVGNEDGKLYLTDVGSFPNFVNPCVDAIQWHLIGNDPDPSKDNQWTWLMGTTYMENALEEEDEGLRNLRLGCAMRCLGEVLHNTADMGLPAHVRNDAHGGYRVAGGSDPYEATYNPDWTEKFGAEKCDKDLADYFRSAKKVEDIHKRLAEFTNKYFFSHETISGKGIVDFHSTSGFKDYPAPKLENFDYDELGFSYKKIFPSGREIKMCVDQSLFMGFISRNFRSYPRVDLSCVESQATELIPDIVEAGINVIRLFIPDFTINLTADAGTGKVSGSIAHRTDEVYTRSIQYKGKVHFWINGKLSNTELKASSAVFSGSVPGMNKGDKIKAVIEFSDITISSDEVTVTQSGGGGSDSKNFKFSWAYKGDMYPRTEMTFGVEGKIETFDGATITEIFDGSYGSVTISFSKVGARFKIDYKVTASHGKTEFDTINVWGEKEVIKLFDPVYTKSYTDGRFSVYYFTVGDAVTYSASEEGSIYTDCWYDEVLEIYDKDGKLKEEHKSQGSLPLVKMHIGF